MNKEYNITVIITVIATFFLILYFTDFNNGEQNSTADGFRITSFEAILDVKEDNKVNVTELIDIHFTNPNKHGIYRFIPSWLEYTSKDGNVVKRKSTIKNLECVGDNFTIDTVKGKTRIKIGDKDRYVGSGTKRYEIKYTYDMGSDPFSGFDEFIFHTFGDYWGTKIRNAQIKIIMPKDIDVNSINFFEDKYRKNNITKKVEYNVDGNVITADLSQLDINSSITVDIELPDHYFTKGSNNYGYVSLLLILGVFSVTAITIYKWTKYGKDNKKKATTIEFYPPDNLDAAEIGYIYNNRKMSNKFVISLIIQLASKGYIKIDELKEENKIQITNLIPKPQEPKTVEELLPLRIINVRKLKDEDDSLNNDESTMMKYLFKKGNVKELKSNIEKFLKVRDSLTSKGYIKVINDNDEQRNYELDNAKKQYAMLSKEYDAELVKYEKQISKVQPLSSLEKIVYNSLFSSKNVIVLSEHKSFYGTFKSVENELKRSLEKKIKDSDAAFQKRVSTARTILCIVLNIYAYSIIKDLNPSYHILYIWSFLCILINVFFTIIMGRKTEYGESITARIKGFRKFLQTVEKDKLEELVSDNPKYFYKILPYTYALNVSKKWIKKFENIKQPKYDMGSFSFNDSSSYYFLFDNVYFPAPSSYSSHSSSSSSCGGGCSSCGGGCSSCGGGGSW